MALFVTGPFESRHGLTLPWKVECEALGPADWDAIAAVAAPLVHPFREVHGVPRGGLPFAEALQPYCTPGGRVLIVDDVWTTGRSMQTLMDHHPWNDVVGCVVFAHHPVGLNVTALWRR